jgi:hypothetical protein
VDHRIQDLKKEQKTTAVSQTKSDHQVKYIGQLLTLLSSTSPQQFFIDH